MATLPNPRVLFRNSRARKRRFPLALAMFESLEPRQLLSALTWTGASGGDWDTGTNWSGGSIPGSADTVTIPNNITINHAAGNTDLVISVTSGTGDVFNLSNGSLSISASSTFDAFTMSGGILTGAGSVTISGLLTFTNGTMTGGGTTTANGGVVMNATNGRPTLTTRTMVNNGTATLSGSNDNLVFYTGAIWTNPVSSVFDIQNDDTLEYGGGTFSTFNNAGTLKKSSGSATSDIGVILNNTGAVNLLASVGTLSMQEGGSATSGTFSVTTGDTLDFDGGTFTIDSGSSETGAGSGTFTNGTVNFAGTYDVSGNSTFTGATATFSGPTTINGVLTVSAGAANFGAATFNVTNILLSNGTLNIGANSFTTPLMTESGGVLSGSGTLTISGLLTFTNGTMTGGGTTTANGGVVMNATNGRPTLTTRTMVNNGTATLSGSNDNLVFYTGAIWTNPVSSVFDIQNDDTLEYGGGTFSTFNNAGTLKKSSGSATSDIGVILNNTGAVNVLASVGTLSMQEGGSATSGTFSVATGDTLDFDGGTFTIDSGSSETGAGSGTFTNGTVNFAGTYDVSGNSTFSGATATFSGPTTINGVLTVSAGAANFGAATFNVTNILLSNGTLNIGANSFTTPLMTESGGVLSGSGTLTISGLLTFTNGTMTGGGTTTANGGVVMNATNGRPTLTTRTMVNNGTATLSGSNDNLVFYTGAIWTNPVSSVFDIQNDDTLEYGGGTFSTFNNAGTLQKSSGTAASDVEVILNNTGAVNVLASVGTLSLQQGGSATSGTFGVATGDTLGFNGGTFTIDSGSSETGAGSGTFTNGTVNFAGTYDLGGTSTFSGATATFSGPTTINGVLTVSAGAANFGAATFNVTNILLSGGTLNIGTNSFTTPLLTETAGTLSGSGTLTISGLLTFSAGNMTGGGTTTANGGVLMNVINSRPLLDNRTMVNNGTATLSGSNDDLDFDNGAIWTNPVSSVFDLQNDDAINYAGGTIPTFNNAGTLQKSSGTASSNIDIILNNSGTLIVESGTGTITLQTTNTNSGTVTIPVGTTLFTNINYTQTAGTTNVNGTLSADGGSSAVMINGGTLNGAGTVVGPVTNAGIVKPGNSPGILTITGNYIQTSAGAFDAQIGGLTAGSQFGQLNISGSATLNGTLNVTLINAFTPTIGNAFQVMSFASETGNFATENGLSFSGGVFNPVLASTNFTLDAASSVASTATAVAPSVNPTVFGQSVMFTATVTTGSGTPTGNVTFKDGATTLGAGTLNGSDHATYSTSSLGLGAHSITAVYAGDSNFSGSTSTPLSETVDQAATTVNVIPSVNPAVFGQSVMLTATVAVSAPGAGTPTGSVTFKDGTTVLGAGTLNGSDQAMLSTSSLTVGAHSITAVYNGDADFTGSTSTAQSETINQAATTSSVITSITPAVFGQSVMFTATVAAVSPGAGTPAGSVTFKDGAATLGVGTLNGSGQAILNTSSLTVGAHSITAVYAGNANFTGSTSTAQSETVNQAATTSSVITSVTPAVFGQSVMFTATVAVSAPGAGTPAGSVTFKDGAATLGVATLNGSGQAMLNTSSLSVGAHSITAVYAGNANFTGSTSTAQSETINQAATSTGVISSVNPSGVGQSIMFTATVAVTTPGAGTPTGSVTFKDGASVLGMGGVDGSGQATFNTSSLALGGHSITAVYSGDSNFTGSTSTALSQTVVSVIPVTPNVTLYSSAILSEQGQNLTLTTVVSVPSTGAPATGTVTFLDDVTVLGTVALSGNGAASLTFSTLSAGQHAIHALYNGAVGLSATTSNVITQMINAASPISGTPNQEFVESLYRDVLHRGASGAEVASWVSNLNSGVSRQQVALDFEMSPEHLGMEVTQFYSQFLHRAPDSSSVNWVNDLESGASINTVEEGFLTSPEYEAYHPASASYVDALYSDVLLRCGDPQGRTFWINALSASTDQHKNVAGGFISSVENETNTIDSLYEDFLYRAPDPSGFSFYFGELNSQAYTASQIASFILGSAEYFGDVTPA